MQNFYKSNIVAPSLAHQMRVTGRNETLLDIDKQFSYLPGFIYYDVTRPTELNKTFKICSSLLLIS